MNLSEAEIERRQALQPEGKTPFILIPAVCPICKNGSVQKFFKSGVYQEGKKDLSLHPESYTFEDPDFKQYHPPLYFIWQCPHCFFSADQSTFEDPVADVVCSTNNFQKRILSQYQDDESFRETVPLLEPVEQREELTFHDSIKQYLMAIHFFQSISSIKDRDALNLARYYIRLAWLYEDLEKSDQRISVKILLDQLKYSIIEYWDEIPLTSKAAMEKALFYYEVAYYNSNILAQKHIEHQVMQVIGRLKLILGNIEEARNEFFKGITTANKYKTELDASFRAAENPDLAREEFLPKISRLEGFIRESQDLMQESKQMLNELK